MPGEAGRNPALTRNGRFAAVVNESECLAGGERLHLVEVCEEPRLPTCAFRIAHPAKGTRKVSVHRTALWRGLSVLATAVVVTSSALLAPSAAAAPTTGTTGSSGSAGVPPQVASVAHTPGVQRRTTPTARLAAADPQMVGAACQPGQGVTVVVDKTPAKNEIDLGCAVGAQPTIGAAFTAGGFRLTDQGGFLCAIDGLVAEPAGCLAWPGAYWSLYTSTSSGLPSGSPSQDWTYANVGIAGGPVPTDSALLFQIQPYVDNWQSPSDNRVPLLALADLPAHRGEKVVPVPSRPATNQPDARAAAGWIGRQLAASGDVFASPYDPTWVDWGLTEDAVIAMASAGVGGDQIARTAAKIQASGEDYVGPAGDGTYSWKYVAKTALVLQIAGLDPTAFPDGGSTRNLLAELRAQLGADGSFGQGDFPFIHALAVLALARTDGGVPASAVTWLEGTQCDTGTNKGAFGYAGCTGVDADGTAWAAQALLGAGIAADDPVLVAADTWLKSQQDALGGMPAGFGGGLNANGAGLAGQTFSALGATASAGKAATFVAGLQLGCSSIKGSKVLTADNLGAIAYNSDGWDMAAQDGLTDNLDQWRRASTQAILALGAPPMTEITAAGADPTLPAITNCNPPSTSTSPSTSTGSSTGTNTSTGATRPTGGSSSHPTSGSTGSTYGSGTRSSATTSVTQAPAGVAVSLSTNVVAAGGSLMVSVSGAPASTPVSIALHSSIAQLGTATTDAHGAASAMVTVPADTELGQHHIVVTIDGTDYQAGLTVVEALAATGLSARSGQAALLALALLLTGAALLVLGRRVRVHGRHRS